MVAQYSIKSLLDAQIDLVTNCEDSYHSQFEGNYRGIIEQTTW